MATVHLICLAVQIIENRNQSYKYQLLMRIELK